MSVSIGTGIALASSVAGGIGSAIKNKKSNRQQLPIEQPEFSPLRDQLLKTAMGRLQSPSTLGPGLEATGMRNINANADLTRQSMENRLGGAGLLGSGVHGAGLNNLDMRRFGDINDLQNIEIPRLERDFANQDFNMANNLFNSRKTGTQMPSSAAGSGLLTASGLLALMYGNGSFGKGGGGGNTLQGFLEEEKAYKGR
jgi:hypothetical protein